MLVKLYVAQGIGNAGITKTPPHCVNSFIMQGPPFAYSA